jgi:AraC-like DNA-binding protein
METDGAAALSAFVTGIALTGALASLRTGEARNVRLSLALVFALFAGLAALPLIAAHARPAYTHYLPAMLPVLLALPAAVHRQAEARTGAAYGRSAKIRDAILPGAGLGVMAGYWLLPDPDRAAMLIDGRLPQGVAAAGLALATFALVLVWIASSGAYLIATLRALHRHRQALKGLYSNTHGLELRWLDAFLILLAGLWTVSALALASDNLAPGAAIGGEVILPLSALVLLALIAVALRPAPPATQPASDLDEPSPPPEKYARSALSDERAQQIAGRIEAAMAGDQLHLDPALSLTRLARHVASPANLVSQTLNEHLGATFFDYVAKWRVESAKPLIAAGEASVLAVALEVGFNTRSTFYKAFKRETGMTPQAYREAAGARP